MKKVLIIITAIVAMGCNQAAKKPAAGNTKQVAKTCKYICIMDKDVCADKPGICPKCGMKLVEKEEK